MNFFIFRITQNLREWTLKWVNSRHAASALFFVAFIEAIFFPVPPDILMIAIVLLRPGNWWYFACVTTAGSVLGAVGGYFVGFGLYETIGRPIVDMYNLNEMVNAVGTKFSQYAFLTVFTAAFTPIPFKVITISAGLFKIPFLSLLLAAIAGRGVRYFAIAFIVKIFGRQINTLVYRYFNIFSLVFIALIIGGFVAIKLFL